MDVIEKAARALAGWTPNVTRWEDVCHDPKDAKALQASYRNNVRVVLLAIREPSEAMVAAGTEDSGIDGYVNDFHPIVPWQAMIDAALECPATPAS
jgi:hypothetical protein